MMPASPEGAFRWKQHADWTAGPERLSVFVVVVLSNAVVDIGQRTAFEFTKSVKKAALWECRSRRCVS
jgi:hypothetical protein